MNSQTQQPTLEPSTPGNSPSGSEEGPSYHDWRTQRRAEIRARRDERREMRARGPFGWAAGVILILIGVAFLLQNMHIILPANWWAVLILIPAFPAYAASWNIYRENHRLTRGAAASLISAIILTVLALLFLLDLAVGLLWPVLLIAGGLALLGVTLLPR
jgi:Na+/proline symporter